MHKEGITELHQFMKAYPQKKSKVDKMLESTGPAFRKYISRALASRAAEDEEREVAVADTLSSECTFSHASKSVSYSSAQGWNPSQYRPHPLAWRRLSIATTPLDPQSAQVVRTVLIKRDKKNCLDYMTFSTIGRVP